MDELQTAKIKNFGNFVSLLALFLLNLLQAYNCLLFAASIEICQFLSHYLMSKKLFYTSAHYNSCCKIVQLDFAFSSLLNGQSLLDCCYPLQGIRPEAFEKVTDTEIKDIIRRCISTTPAERYK